MLIPLPIMLINSVSLFPRTPPCVFFCCFLSYIINSLGQVLSCCSVFMQHPALLQITTERLQMILLHIIAQFGCFSASKVRQLQLWRFYIVNNYGTADQQNSWSSSPLLQSPPAPRTSNNEKNHSRYIRMFPYAVLFLGLVYIQKYVQYNLLEWMQLYQGKVVVLV